MADPPTADPEYLLGIFKKKANHILEILKAEKKKDMDVGEFIETIELLIPLLNRISREIVFASKEVKEAILIRLHGSLEDYEAQVEKIQKTQNFKRILTTRSLRKNLEKHNAKVATNLEFFAEQITKMENTRLNNYSGLQPPSQQTVGGHRKSDQFNFAHKLETELRKLEKKQNSPPDDDFAEQMASFEEQLTLVKNAFGKDQTLHSSKGGSDSHNDNDIEYGGLEAFRKTQKEGTVFEEGSPSDEYSGLPIKLSDSSQGKIDPSQGKIDSSQGKTDPSQGKTDPSQGKKQLTVSKEEPISRYRSKGSVLLAKAANLKQGSDDINNNNSKPPTNNDVYISVSDAVSERSTTAYSAISPNSLGMINQSTSNRAYESIRERGQALSALDEKWNQKFGLNSPAKWGPFIEFLRDSQIIITENQTKIFKYLLDNSNTGFVSRYKYKEFLRGFGPISQLHNHIKEVFQEKFFYGYLSSKESESLLITQPPGTYLLRLSKSSAGSFAIAVVTKPHHIVHILLNHSESGNYEVFDDTPSGKRTFSTLKDALAFYSHILYTPYVSTVPLQPWFAGDLTSDEAEEFLKDQPIGSYMVRFSSQVGYFAASYKESPTTSKHVLIAYTLNSKTGEETCTVYGEKEPFPTLGALLNFHSSVLKQPVKNEDEITIGRVKELLEISIHTEPARPESTSLGRPRDEVVPANLLFKIPLEPKDNPRYMHLTPNQIKVSNHEFKLEVTWVSGYDSISPTTIRIISPETKCTVNALSKTGKDQMIKAVQNRISEFLKDLGWDRPNEPERENEYRFAKYSFANGQEYEGEWEAAYFHGKGKHKLHNGSVYEGMFKHSVRDGSGIFTELNGSKFNGEWKEGVRHGWGVQTYPPNLAQVSYEGQWKQDQRVGLGSLHYADKTTVFYEWDGDIPQTLERIITISYPDGKTYTGFCANSSNSAHAVIRSGFGAMFYPNGDKFYGLWNNDKMNGSGFYTSTDFEFRGEFSDGKTYGNGVMITGSSTISGTFFGDIESGQLDMKQAVWTRVTGKPVNQWRKKATILKGTRWLPLIEWKKWKETKKDSTAKILEESLSDVSKDASDRTKFLSGALRCESHPLGMIFKQFTSWINIHYSRIRVPQVKYSTQALLEDITAFLNAFVDHILRLYKNLNDELVRTTLRDVLLPRISQTAYLIMDQNMLSQVQSLKRKFDDFNAVSEKTQFELMGVEQQFYEIDFSNAVEILQSIRLTNQQLRSPAERVTCLLQTAQAIETKLSAISKGPVGADQLLPCICLVLAKSGIHDLPVQIEFISNFLDESLEADIQGYVLTQFHVALTFLTELRIPQNEVK